MMWNIFRYLADFSHLISVVILLYKMFSKKSCSGISLKTQFAYLVVFLTRYCNDGFFDPPLYNILFKIFYIGSALAICVIMKFGPTNIKYTYEDRHDTFRVTFLFIISLPLAYFTRPYKSLYSFVFAYSLWVECVAILPQIFLMARSSKFDIMNREYVFFLSVYRLFYLLNWIYKLVTDTGKTPHVVWITGIIQTLIYSDFIYEYFKLKISGRSAHLPL
ncbi:ER lumen protein retaining receptor [Tritrichomonas foetus]|uniref:ER lumen protein retaining receptor n=1 Tax=Tritrichomonas foetus TaxID=1144522 RepID=A0A1J4JNC4_9EUKA|nr:ER lumen protein retaining receptor [Tritrichomonas foetus]|eukprot:OHS99935.1 ER lumen protein retaining receptor [Tritrichomonas foetus]